MAAPPPPDEQDFIQAYEEVRERYKGTRRRRPAGRSASQSAGPGRPVPGGPDRAASPSPVPVRPAGLRRPGARGTGRRGPRCHALNRASRCPGGGGGGGPVSRAPGPRSADARARGSRLSAPARQPVPPTRARGGRHRLAVGRIAVASPHCPNGPGSASRLLPLAATPPHPCSAPAAAVGREVRAAPVSACEDTAAAAGFAQSPVCRSGPAEIRTAARCPQPGRGPSRASQA